MSDLNERIVAALDARYPGGTWDVLPGQFTAYQDVCQPYPSALAAHRYLIARGYAVTSKFVPMPPVDQTHDVTTVLRYARDEDTMLVLLKRRSAGPF